MKAAEVASCCGPGPLRPSARSGQVRSVLLGPFHHLRPRNNDRRRPPRRRLSPRIGPGERDGGGEGKRAASGVQCLLPHPQGLPFHIARRRPCCHRAKDTRDRKVNGEQNERCPNRRHVEVQRLPSRDFGEGERAEHENGGEGAKGGAARLTGQHGAEPQKFRFGRNPQEVNASHASFLSALAQSLPRKPAAD